MKIERMDYSRGPWRLLDDNGNDVYWQKPMKHPDLGETWVSMPVCGETKAECITETLALLSLALRKLRDVAPEPKGFKLLPEEPTPAMLAAMQSSGWLPGCYRAMLAAAPARETSANN